MPNWCETSYSCTGDEKQVFKLYKALQYLENLESPLIKSDFGNLWCGCVVNYFGGDWNSIHCRGRILGYEYSEETNMLYIDVESAWVELDEWRNFIKSKLPGIEIVYTSYEPGCEYYVTNDERCRYSYYFEGYDTSLYFCTIDEIKDVLKREANIDVDTEEDIMKLYEEDDNIYYFAKCEFIEND